MVALPTAHRYVALSSKTFDTVQTRWVSARNDLPELQFERMKNVSLIHAAGLYESRGRVRKFFLGHSDGLLFGKYRGMNQSRLSAMVSPPKKLPYASPLALWLVGFFPLIAFVGLGKQMTFTIAAILIAESAGARQ